MDFPSQADISLSMKHSSPTSSLHSGQRTMERRKVSLNLLGFLAIVAVSAEGSKYHEYIAKSDMTARELKKNNSLAEKFSEMGVEIVYIDSRPVIKSDNHGERMMGVSDEKCDNGRVNN